MTLLCSGRFELPEWLRDSDLLGAAFGSFLGFGLAWILLRYQFKKEKSRKAEERIVELNTYFDEARALLKQATRGWKSTGTKYQQLSEAYERDWYQQFPHPTTVNVAEITLNRLDRMLLREAFVQRLGQRKGRSGYGSLIFLVDYFRESRPFVEGAVLAIKKEIALRSDRFDELQIEIGMALSQQYFRLGAEGRQDDPCALEFARIMEGYHPLYVDINNRPTPVDIHDKLIVPCLELRRKGFHSADVEVVLDAAKRSQLAYYKIMSASKGMVEFAAIQARRTAKQIRRATALLKRCESAVFKTL